MTHPCHGYSRVGDQSWANSTNFIYKNCDNQLSYTVPGATVNRWMIQQKTPLAFTQPRRRSTSFLHWVISKPDGYRLVLPLNPRVLNFVMRTQIANGFEYSNASHKIKDPFFIPRLNWRYIVLGFQKCQLFFLKKSNGNAHLRMEIFAQMQRKMSPLWLLQDDLPEMLSKGINEIMNWSKTFSHLCRHASNVLCNVKDDHS